MTCTTLLVFASIAGITTSTATTITTTAAAAANTTATATAAFTTNITITGIIESQLFACGNDAGSNQYWHSKDLCECQTWYDGDIWAYEKDNTVVSLSACCVWRSCYT